MFLDQPLYKPLKPKATASTASVIFGLYVKHMFHIQIPTTDWRTTIMVRWEYQKLQPGTPGRGPIPNFARLMPPRRRNSDIDSPGKRGHVTRNEHLVWILGWTTFPNPFCFKQFCYLCFYRNLQIFWGKLTLF